MKAKIKAFIVSVLIIGFLFVLGFFLSNAVMKIVVGHGNEVMVPNITGLHFDVARKKLKNMDLYVQQVEQKSNDEVAKGYIISQSPHPNIKTKKSRTVEVVVSSGPEMVKVPYLDNISISEASVRLQNTGLKLGKKSYRYSDDVKKDNIIYSQPLAEDMVGRGSKVDVFISLGKLPSGNKWKYKSLLDQAGDE